MKNVHFCFGRVHLLLIVGDLRRPLITFTYKGSKSSEVQEMNCDFKLINHNYFASWNYTKGSLNFCYNCPLSLNSLDMIKFEKIDRTRGDLENQNYRF